MMYFYENKETILNMLFQTLKQTVAGIDIVEMRYEMLTNGTELVVIIYDSGKRKPVNVSADSGIALMRDVLRAIAD